jgi:hypothetical protein
LHDGVIFRRAGEILMFRTMQFWGTWLGYRQGGTLSRELKRRFYYPAPLRRPQADPAARTRRRVDYSASGQGPGPQ